VTKHISFILLELKSKFPHQIKFKFNSLNPYLIK